MGQNISNQNKTTTKNSFVTEQKFYQKRQKSVNLIESKQSQILSTNIEKTHVCSTNFTSIFFFFV